MIFSAKEAIFKAVYPIEQVWLGFADAELTWSSAGSALHATATLLKSPGAAYPVGTVLEVRCQRTASYVLTTTWLA
jgi:4'-phosphopantetheinyl transferase EntD